MCVDYFRKMLAKIRWSSFASRQSSRPSVRQFWFRSGDHTKKVFSFFRFLYATPNNVAKVFLRHALVCFAIVCADTCSAADELIDQAVVRWITWNSFGESHDRFTKYCSGCSSRSNGCLGARSAIGASFRSKTASGVTGYMKGLRISLSGVEA